MLADRLPPHDISAEESVIGSLLIDGEAITQVSPFLDPDDFYRERNRWCFETCLDLFERGEAINQITVAHDLERQERLSEVGGTAYLSQLVSAVPTSLHIEYYARIVQRTATMRRLISVAGDIASIGYHDDPDVDNALTQAEELLFHIRTGHSTRDFTLLREVLDTYLEDTTPLGELGDPSRQPVRTGFRDLDTLLGGFQRSDMIVLAARPSIGKSTIALNVARNAAADGMNVGIFSLEMGREQIGLRLLSSEANIDSYRLRVGLVSESEERRLLDSIGALSDLPLYIDDTPIQGIVEMRGKARRLQSEKGLDLLVVDYLQLIAGSSRGRIDNRVQEMGEISRSLKGLARDLDIPVLACSQLSRAVEQRPSHRPILSDLRESGSIEQDADVVAFIYREDQYTTKEEWEKRNPSAPYPERIAELIVSKHRNGPLGVIPLYFRNEVVRFESLESPTHSMEYA